MRFLDCMCAKDDEFDRVQQKFEALRWHVWSDCTHFPLNFMRFLSLMLVSGAEFRWETAPQMLTGRPVQRARQLRNSRSPGRCEDLGCETKTYQWCQGVQYRFELCCPARIAPMPFTSINHIRRRSAGGGCSVSNDAPSAAATWTNHQLSIEESAVFIEESWF